MARIKIFQPLLKEVVLNPKYSCMQTIKINDLTFKPFLKEAEIVARIGQLASQIEAEYHHKNPLFLCVLNGSFFFAYRRSAYKRSVPGYM